MVEFVVMLSILNTFPDVVAEGVIFVAETFVDNNEIGSATVKFWALPEGLNASWVISDLEEETEVSPPTEKIGKLAEMYPPINV